VFLRESAGGVQFSEYLAGHNTHPGYEGFFVHPDDNVTARGGNLLIPDLQVVRFLNVRVEILSRKTWFGLLEAGGNRVAKYLADTRF
jgi:hypothetical protein